MEPDAERLLELARMLDEPFSPRRHLVFLTLLAVRSRALFAAVMHCSDDGTAPAVGPLLRAMTEANIAIRFVCEGDSELLLDLWEAERERGRLALEERLRRLANRGSRWGPVLSPEQVTSIEAHVQEARQRGVAAGVPDVRERGGALFSGVGAQVDSLDTEPVIEMYALAYGPLSADVHIGAGAFTRVTVDQVDDRVRVSDAVSAEEGRAARCLAITVFASTLVMVDLHRRLGIGEEVDRIKRHYIPHERPLGERYGEATR